MNEKNMMIYDNVIPSENCKKIIELFEKSKHQIETFETGRKEYTEIDIDKFDIPWFETKQTCPICRHNITSSTRTIGDNRPIFPPV